MQFTGKLMNQIWKNSRELGMSTTDLFANWINHQIEMYISWKPDSKAIAINSFSVKWNTEFYAFPLFNLLGKVAAKTRWHNTKCKVVMSKWITQQWYRNLIKRNTILIQPWPQNLLRLQDPEKLHLLLRKMHIQALLTN